MCTSPLVLDMAEGRATQKGEQHTVDEPVARMVAGISWRPF